MLISSGNLATQRQEVQRESFQLIPYITIRYHNPHKIKETLGHYSAVLSIFPLFTYYGQQATVTHRLAAATAATE